MRCWCWGDVDDDDDDLWWCWGWLLVASGGAAGSGLGSAAVAGSIHAAAEMETDFRPLGWMMERGTGKFPDGAAGLIQKRGGEVCPD